MSKYADTSELRFGSVQNLYLELETLPLTELFRSHDGGLRYLRGRVSKLNFLLLVHFWSYPELPLSELELLMEDIFCVETSAVSPEVTVSFKRQTKYISLQGRIWQSDSLTNFFNWDSVCLDCLKPSQYAFLGNKSGYFSRYPLQDKNRTFVCIAHLSCDCFLMKSEACEKTWGWTIEFQRYLNFSGSGSVKAFICIFWTRIHSTRMRTAHSLTVSRSIRVSDRGRLPNPPGCRPTPREQNDWQTDVET